MSSVRYITLLGTLAAITAFFSFTVLDSLIKYSGQFYTPLVISFYLRLFATLIIFLINSARCIALKNLTPFKLHKPLSVFLRTLLMPVMTILFSLGFTSLPLSNAYSIIYALPILSALFGWIFLKEHISKLTWSAIIVGFLGVLIILRPGLTVVSMGYFFILGAICVEVPYFLIIRYFHKEENPFTTIFYPSLFTTIIIGIFVIITGNSMQAIEVWHVLLFVGMGITNCSSQALLAYALKTTDTNITLSMQYTQIIWGTLAGIIFFQDTSFEFWVFIGTLIIVCAGYVIIFGKIPFMKKRNKSN